MQPKVQIFLLMRKMRCYFQIKSEVENSVFFSVSFVFSFSFYFFHLPPKGAFALIINSGNFFMKKVKGNFYSCNIT